MPPGPPRATEMARHFVDAVLHEGGFAVDLTAGNGHDTRFLAERVGESGRVLSIDLQPEGVEATLGRLRDGGLEGRVDVRLGDHARLAGHLDAPGWNGRAIDAAMANLGYLPGGSRHVITRPESTIAALDAVLARLARGGVVTVVIYTGHPGGAEEGRAVVDRLRSLDSACFRSVRFHALNADRPAPELVAAWRIG